MGSAVVTGKVIRFDEVRGYGFVAPDAGTEDVFLHVNDLHFDKRLLTTGMRVRFTVEEGDRGLKASQVDMLDEAPAAARMDNADDELCDILSSSEFVAEITEALVTSVPTITAAQILSVRGSLVTLARKHGWVED